MKKVALALIALSAFATQAQAEPHAFVLCMQAAVAGKPNVSGDAWAFVKMNCMPEARDLVKECVRNGEITGGMTAKGAENLCSFGILLTARAITAHQDLEPVLKRLDEMASKARAADASGQSKQDASATRGNGATELTYGALVSKGPQWTEQTIALKNTGNRTIASAIIECGFFDGECLVGSGVGPIYNLPPQETGYQDVDVWQNADRAVCRVSSISFEK